MLAVVSDFLDSFPPLLKELILLVLGLLLVRAAWKGGSARDKFFPVAK